MVKKRPHVGQHSLSEVLKRFPSTKGTRWAFRDFFVSLLLSFLLNSLDLLR